MSETGGQARLDAILRRLAAPRFETLDVPGGRARLVAGPNATRAALLHALLDEIDATVLATRLVFCAPDADAPRLSISVTGRRVQDHEVEDLVAELDRFAAAVAGQPVGVLTEPAEEGRADSEEADRIGAERLARELALDGQDAAPAAAESGAGAAPAAGLTGLIDALQAAGVPEAWLWIGDESRESHGEDAAVARLDALHARGAGSGPDGAPVLKAWSDRPGGGSTVAAIRWPDGPSGPVTALIALRPEGLPTLVRAWRDLTSRGDATAE